MIVSPKGQPSTSSSRPASYGNLESSTKPNLAIIFICLFMLSHVQIRFRVNCEGSGVWTPSSLDNAEQLLFKGNQVGSSCGYHYCLLKNNSETWRPSSSCHCDADCWKRRDCCLDTWSPRDDRSSDDINYPRYVEDLMDNDRLTCQSIVTRHEPAGIKVTTIFAMVAECERRQHQHQWLEECENLKSTVQQDPLTFVPVTSHVTNITYRNIFCAVCNGDVSNVSFWKVDLSCRNQIQNATDALKHYLKGERRSKCNMEINPSISGSTELVKCMKPPAKMPSDRSEMVSNCAQRNSDKVVKLSSWLCRTIYAPVFVQNTPYRNIYCAICNDAVNIIANYSEPKCHARERHSYMFKCPPVCPPIFSIRTRSFTLLMDVDLGSGGLVVGTSERCPVGHIYDIFNEQCRTIVCGKGYELKDSACVKIFQEVVKNETSTLALMTNDSYNEHEIDTWNCIKIRYLAEDVELGVNGTLFIRRTRQTYPSGKYEWEWINRNQSSVLVCIDLRNNYVTKFPDDAFEYLTIGGSILSVISLFLKMAIFACLPETRNFPDRIVFCLSLSLFVAQSLFATTVTNSSVDPQQQYIPCVATAVLAHYFFLSSFAWMNVLAYDVSRTFASTKATTQATSSRQKKFLKYSAYAWGLPFGLVLTSIFLDFTRILDLNSPFRPYYGLAICWISGRLALLCLFVIPVGLLIGANSVFFSCTAWNIWSSSRQASIAQKAKSSINHKLAHCHKAKSQHVMFSLYVKLGMVMGLTWIVGFVAIYARMSFVWYAFTFFNTLQGVYIFFAFTPFRKIRRVWHRLRHSSRCNNHLTLQRSSTKSSQVTRTSSLGNQRSSSRISV